jgi:hypothetical protein
MATKSNKTAKVTFKGSKNIGSNVKFTPAKSTSTKANSRKTVAKKKASYETPVSNIQKITYPSGRVAYRVRVAGQSQFTSSLKKAREIKKEMFA